MDPLSVIGTIGCIAYVIFIFLFQWVTDWYFNVEESPILTHIYSCWLLVTFQD